MFEIWGLAVGLIGGAGGQLTLYLVNEDSRALTVNFSADNDRAATDQYILYSRPMSKRTHPPD